MIQDDGHKPLGTVSASLARDLFTLRPEKKVGKEVLAQNFLRLLVCVDSIITVSLGHPTSISPQRPEQPEVMSVKLSEAEDTK